ncbi:HAD family hydrolase [Rhodococcus sp. D-6]|uniref:HAD family hydrolase n=1 Tax=Rhodococcus sp. D-6 TaxID=1387842 RepID=A0AAU7USF4_9NOCA|nr:HAD family hydrolase [Rhodococcus sp. HS-D2]
MATDVFFDFFGTLVDYDPSIHPASHNAPHEFGLRAGVRLTGDEADALWDRAWTELDRHGTVTGVEHSMRDIAGRYWELLGSPTVGDGEFDRLVADYLDAWTAEITPAAFAADCLADLAADHRLTIVSNTHDAALVPALARRFGLDTHISEIVTSIEVGWRKPHPEIFRIAMDRRGVRADAVVFVGDNWTADVEGPQRAGMTAFYVGKAGAERTPTSLDRLPDLIRALA